MSNKFTGITSGGDNIPVYDKAAHEALSGKQDTLTFDFNDDDAISAINGSALAGQGSNVTTDIGAFTVEPNTAGVPVDVIYPTDVTKFGTPSALLPGAWANWEGNSGADPNNNGSYLAITADTNTPGYTFNDGDIIEVTIPDTISGVSNMQMCYLLSGFEVPIAGPYASNSVNATNYTFSAGVYRLTATQNPTPNYGEVLALTFYRGASVYGPSGIDSITLAKNARNIANGIEVDLNRYYVSANVSWFNTAYDADTKRIKLNPGYTISSYHKDAVDTVYAKSATWGSVSSLLKDNTISGNVGYDKTSGLFVKTEPDQVTDIGCPIYFWPSCWWGDNKYHIGISPASSETSALIDAMNDDHDKKITFILPSACFSSTYWTTATLSGNGFNSNLSLRFYPIPGTSSYSAETSANAWGIVKTGRFTNIIIRTNNYDPSWTASPGTSGTSGYNGYASGTPVVNTVFSNEPIATKNYVDSAIAGLMETSGLEYDGDKISGYMGSAFAGGGSTYSAGANINITDDVISGKDWSEEIPDIIQLSAGPNIDIYSANNTVFISAAAGGGGVPQSAFDAATAKIEQLESILSAYSGQWLLA